MTVDVSPRTVGTVAAAQMLGVSPSTLRRMVATGELPLVSMSRRIRRVRLVDIETLLASVSSLPCGTDADPTTTNPAA